jgi:hypothetical protein
VSAALFSTFDGSCVIAWHPIAVGVGGFPGLAESIAAPPSSFEEVLPPSPELVLGESLPPSAVGVGEALGSLEHPAHRMMRTMCFRMRGRLRTSAREPAIDRA